MKEANDIEFESKSILQVVETPMTNPSTNFAYQKNIHEINYSEDIVLHSFISSRPEKYEKIVLDSGLNLWEM